MNTELIDLNDVRHLNPDLENLYTRFGKVTVFVPWPKPNVPLPGDKWGKFNLEESLRAPYQAKLRRSDVGVQCGKESGNLVAIQFRSSKDAAKFVDSTPLLHSTLSTRHDKTTTLFIRITSDGPPTVRGNQVSWLSDGEIVPVYFRRNPTTIEVLKDGDPVQIDFEAVNWPEELHYAFAVMFNEKSHGALVSADHSGKQKLNHLSIAYLLNRVKPLVYDPACKQFKRAPHRRGAISEPVARAEVQENLLRIVRSAAAEANIAPTPTDIEHCLEFFEIISASRSEPRSLETKLEEFVDANYQIKPGSDVTGEEIFQKFSTHCMATQARPPVESSFYNALPPVIQKLFGLRRSNDVWRGDSQRRGYHNMAPK